MVQGGAPDPVVSGNLQGAPIKIAEIRTGEKLGWFHPTYRGYNSLLVLKLFGSNLQLMQC